jgi:hypothetical protein
MLSYALVSRASDVQRGAFSLALAYACLVAFGGYLVCRARFWGARQQPKGEASARTDFDSRAMDRYVPLRMDRGSTADTSADERGVLREVGWGALAAALAASGYAFVFRQNPRFFFIDDLQQVILPTIYELGRQLRSGVWPMVQQRTWHSSFVPGDPQYGLFNPVSMVSYVLVSWAADVQRGAFLLALGYACLVALGGYVACRAAGVRPTLAALGGASLATAPYVLYWNAASWHFGLVSYSWFVWAVAVLLAARRTPHRGWLLALPTYLVFTSGWPTALVALGLCYATVIGCDVLLLRRPVRAYVPTVLGATAGVLAGAIPWVIAVDYLAIARRESVWENTGFLTLHLEGLAGLFSPVARPFMVTYDGARIANHPITFVSVLVVTGLVLWRLHPSARLGDASVTVAAVVLLLATLGPSQAGPMRYPFRFLPFGLALVLVATLAILSRAMARELPPSPPRRFARLGGFAALVLWLCFTQRPSAKHVLYNAALLAFGGVMLVALVERRRGGLAIGLAYAAAIAAFVTIVLTKPAMTDLADWGAPARLEQIEDDVRWFDGQRTVLLMAGLDPASGRTIRQIPSGSYSLFSARAGPILGGYSPTPLRQMSDALFCADQFGWSRCRDVVGRLFAAEPETGALHVDLLAATQVLAQRGPIADELAASVPPGWHREAGTPHLDRWVRDLPRALPANVGWASPRVSIRGHDDGTVHVEAPAGGDVVFARPWLPGMHVALEGRDLPLSRLWDLYARVRLAAGAVGRLEIRYEVPRRTILGMLVVAALASLVGAIVVARRA